MIPYGVFANSSAVFLGGLLGVLGARIFSKELLGSLTPVLGLSAMTIGMVNIIKLANLPPVILALLAGTLVGEALKLEARANTGITKLEAYITVSDRALYLSSVVLFCVSGTGIFGALHAGMSGDHTILYTKAILDFFTAFSFAATLGIAVSYIALPQFLVQVLLFYFAAVTLQKVDQTMLANFQAVGGVITFAIGMRVLQLREMRVLNYTPALLLIFPLTALWELVV